MIDQSATLQELPSYWQEEIRQLRIENRDLRSRLRGRGIPSRADLDELPSYWRSKIAKLRSENGRLRIERNEARAELAALRAERV